MNVGLEGLYEGKRQSARGTNPGPIACIVRGELGSFSPECVLIPFSLGTSSTPCNAAVLAVFEAAKSFEWQVLLTTYTHTGEGFRDVGHFLGVSMRFLFPKQTIKIFHEQSMKFPSGAGSKEAPTARFRSLPSASSKETVPTRAGRCLFRTLPQVNCGTGKHRLIFCMPKE